MSNIYRAKPYLIILLVLFIAYLPLSSFHFAMKNDAFSDNFFNKFFFTESIHSGFLPLWNPYLNFGYPIYADPGFSFWSPITWLFGTIIGYNAYTLTFEALLYIYIAGIGMFNLAKYQKFNINLCITLGCMFMCSGFFIGNLQHINFLTSAAFLPWVVLGLLKIVDLPSLRSSVIFIISLYFIICGGHPAIPILTIYFLILLISLLFILRYKEIEVPKVCIFLGISFIITFILFAPGFFSYLDILNVYSRKSAVNQALSSDAGFNLPSYLSFLFPIATGVKSDHFFNDDLSMRNAYFSVVGFVMLLVSFCSAKHPLQKVFLTAGIIILLFCFGGSLKAHLYAVIPFLKYIKTNGEFRIFSILCFCLTAGFGLNQLLQKNSRIILNTNKIIILLASASFIALATVFIKYNTATRLFFASLEPLTVQNIKLILDNSSLSVYLLISISITLIILVICLVIIKKKKYNLIYLLIISDLIINTIFYLPITGVGQKTLREIQSYYNESPKGIPIPELIPINSQKVFNKEIAGLIGDWSLYGKQPGAVKLADYPSYFSSTEEFLTSSAKDKILEQPFLFVKKHRGEYIARNVIKIEYFSPTSIKLTVQAEKNDSLILLQNHYKYWHAFRNHKEVNISSSNISFMAVALNDGANTIEFKYNDNKLNTILLFSFISVLIIVISLSTFFRTRY